MGTRMRITALALLAALAAAVPARLTAVPAQDTIHHEADQVTDVLMRIDGAIRVGAGDTVNTVVVVDGDALIDGVVREQVVVIGGTARVAGTVRGNVAAAGGRVELLPGARVGRDVLLYRSELVRDPEARIEGVVRERHPFGFDRLVGIVFWLGGTVFAVLAGLLFAGLAGRQLGEAAALIRNRTGASVLTAAILVIGLPLLAILAMLTIVGVPLGLVILLMVLPVLSVLGYVVAADAVGAALLRRIGGRAAARADAARPYLAAAVGVVLLQVLGLIPILGALVTVVAAPLGAGALVYRSWRMLRAR